MARRIFNATQLRGFLSKAGCWPIIKKVDIVKADNGKVLAELKIEKEHTDMHGNLHVGFSAFLIDTYTTSTLLTLDQVGKNWFCSIDMNINNISTAVVGDDLVIDARIHTIEKNLAYTNCEIRNKVTGKLISKCSHSHYIFTDEIAADA